MKTYRPLKAGHILLYALVVICTLDAINSLYRYFMARAMADSTYSDMFLLWTLILCPIALCYGYMYFQTRISIEGNSLYSVRPIMIQPEPGEKRAMFLFRSGDKDYKVVKMKFDMDKVTAFGYVEDMNVKPQDKSETGPKNKLFPLHEVAFKMESGKVNRINIAIYSAKQQKAIFESVTAACGVTATGKLAEDIKALA